MLGGFEIQIKNLNQIFVFKMNLTNYLELPISIKLLLKKYVAINECSERYVL